MTDSALDSQHGGDHYQKLGDYQPWNVLEKWLTPEELRGFMKGTVIAYLARERDKGGDLDIEKAMHTMQIYRELAAKTPSSSDERAVVCVREEQAPAPGDSSTLYIRLVGSTGSSKTSDDEELRVCFVSDVWCSVVGHGGLRNLLYGDKSLEFSDEGLALIKSHARYYR